MDAKKIIRAIIIIRKKIITRKILQVKNVNNVIIKLGAKSYKEEMREEQIRLPIRLKA